MEQYDIFISCKSEDYEIAEKVYSFLKDNGFSVFLSSKELRRMAQADYMDAISVALDTAYSMIVISTKKEYLNNVWVRFEWNTFLNEILIGRKNGQIITLVDNIKVNELPIQLRNYESFTLENYEYILPYLENPKKQVESQKEVTQDVNNDRTNSAEVQIETDIACRVMRFKEELITAVPDDDNLIKLKKGTHKLTFVSIENEQDNYSQVFTIKNDCEFLQVNLTKIRDARLANEKAERKRTVLEDAEYDGYRESVYKKEGYDIFISCKSQDYEVAEKVYNFLTNKNNGYSVFLASEELRRMGKADYMEAISVALESAYCMIVISTKKEYLNSKWVKLEWCTFLNAILNERKNGQIMTLVDNIKKCELPILLSTYESFPLENYENIRSYIKQAKMLAENHELRNEATQVNKTKIGAAEVHIETDIACRIMRFKEELITALPDDDNLIHLKRGTHKLKFVSLENEQDNYSQVYTVKDDCEFLQVNLTKIRDARLAKQEEERRAKEEKHNTFDANIGAAEVHIETDIACRIMRFKEELITARADDDNLILLKKGTHKLTFVSLENEQDNYSQVFTVKDECEFLQVNLTEIRDARLAKEETERQTREADRKRLAKEDGKYNYFVNNGKWGFTKDGVVVIPAKYDIALSFSEGLARVKLCGKWGYIDHTGKEVIPVQFSDVCEFNDGLAKVKLKGKWGIIDKDGNFTPNE